MGGIGQGFGQGFAQTLLTLGPQIEARQREREQLEIQKKLADATFKLHDAQTQALTQKLQTEQGLRELLTNGVPGDSTPQSDNFGMSLGSQPGARTPFNVANPQHRQLLMAIDPSFREAELKGQISNQNTLDMAQKLGFGTPGAAPHQAPVSPTDALSGELGILPRPGGGRSTEISITVTDPRLNGGRPTNLPLLVQGQTGVDRLLRGEQWTPEQEEIAVRRAIERVNGGAALPAYNSIAEAEAAARQRSEAGGSAKKFSGAIPVAVEGGRVVPKRSMVIGSDGKAQFHLDGEIVKYSVQSGTIRNEDGTEQMVSYAVDPINGQPIMDQATGKPLYTPIGPPMPTKELIELHQQLKGFGVEPNSPLAAPVLAQLQRAKLIVDGKTRDAFTAQLEAEVAAAPAAMKTVAAPGTPQPMTAKTPTIKASIAGAQKTASLTDAQSAADKITAETPAKVAQAEALIKAETPLKAAQAKDTKTATESVPERPSADERKVMGDQLASIDALNQVSTLYKPEYVGGVTGRVGAVRERIGAMNAREAQFRQSVNAANNAQARAFGGANLTPTEISRIESQQPTTELPANVFEARVEMSKINNKILAIRKRQVLEGSGIDVSRLPSVTLTRTEQQKVSAPIIAEYQMGQISRQEAAAQLQGLSQYSPGMAQGILTTIDKGQ